MISEPKLRPQHHDRLAAVYVRQSTLHQVRNHTASGEVQYGLVQRAVDLGWMRERVSIYDGDQGVTGSVAGVRRDFRQLVADVGMGRIGIVVGFDVTRMARNNADWYRLLDLCAILDTLIADGDGVYDPALYNDRLILGLKGTLSEGEHHLIRMRLQAGIKARAEAGALRKRLPVGLEYDEAGQVRLSTDEAIRHAIATVFRKFDELGSGHAVFRELQDERTLLPTRKHEQDSVRWVRPRYNTVLGILRNPRFAGAYVFGQSRAVRTVDADGDVHRRMEHLPRQNWKVVIEDHHPGYITWARYLENQVALSKNGLCKSRSEGSTVLREGNAILQGLVSCGVCGRRMSPMYASRGDKVRYHCIGRRRDGLEGHCNSVGGTRLHRAVSDALLEALESASMLVTLEAIDALEGTESDALKQLLLRRERAQYETERAKRQYDQVEPENRLVARTLERDWNHKLQSVTDLDRQIEERRNQQPSPLTPSEKEKLLRVGVDLRRVWESTETTSQERKQLLRAAFDDVVVHVLREKRIVNVTLIWQGGATTQLSIQLPRLGAVRPSDEASVVEDVRRMAKVMTDNQIANTLVRRGLRTAAGLSYTVCRVVGLRKRHGIPKCKEVHDDSGPWYTCEQVADRFGVSYQTIFRWLKEGFLVGEQPAPRAPWRIKLGDMNKLRVAERAPSGWLHPKAAAKALRVSRRKVLHWVQTGELEAVMVGKGRRSGLRINVLSRISRKQRGLFDQS
jgi:excisionase family DNA binding protein